MSDIPKEAKDKLLNKIKNTLNSKNNKKFLLLFIAQEKKGTSIGFLSGFNDMETLGHIEKAKLFTYERIATCEHDRTSNKRLVDVEEKVVEGKLSYVS